MKKGGISSLSRIEQWRRKKEEKNKEKNKKYDEKNRKKRASSARERRQKNKGERSVRSVLTRHSVKAVHKATKQREKRAERIQAESERKEKIRAQTRERVRKLRLKKKASEAESSQAPSATLIYSSLSSAAFPNRMAKARAFQKVSNVLPETPEKKAEVVERIAQSPRTKEILQLKRIIHTPEEQRELTTLRALAADIAEGMNEVKKHSSTEKRAAYSSFKSLAFGENIRKSRSQKSLSKIISLDERSIAQGINRRMEILKGEEASWLATKRKVRADAIGEDVKELVYNYWTHQASRPTGDKKDIIRSRTGKKQYVQHARHILEKSQTEAFIEFQGLHPEIKIKQRKFESLKPYFVKPARERDRKSCLCRKHVEAQIVFKDCMKFRKAALKEKGDEVNETPQVPKSLTEVAELTLCEKPEGSLYHSMKCLERKCSNCGVNKFKLLPEEESNEGLQVQWSRYEYVGTGKFLPNGQEKKKITLVRKETAPKELFEYFRKLLEDYPLHSFMAKWQRDQLDKLLEHLPVNHVVCVHDYSEGYSCRQQDEVQSEYFDVMKVSLHVTILYRHAQEDFDGVQSTDDEPCILKEHIFVISEDAIQDHDSVHNVQQIINNYLRNEVSYPTAMIHEFTDGCSAQYKSRHCAGDLSCCLADFGYLIQRNYFETSHAKGEQDAAGANIKQKVTQAVIRRTATIRNAKEMHEYLSQSFTTPAASTFSSRAKSVDLKRRLFFFVPSTGEDAVARNRPGRKFLEVKGIRKWHSIMTTSVQGNVLVRRRSCYCYDCLSGDPASCNMGEWVDEWQRVEIAREPSTAVTRQASEEASILPRDTSIRLADLAGKDSIVAVAAEDDPSYDYYLLKITSDGVEELTAPFTDDYGLTFGPGFHILKGHFLIRENLIDMSYKLDDKRLAAVHAATVRHICGELAKTKGRRPVFKISIEQNEEIMASL